MAITSIMRDKIGTNRSLGSVTINVKENANTILKKGIRFINRNLNKREKPVSEQEIRNVLSYLFEVDPKDLKFNNGITTYTEEEIEGIEDEDLRKYTKNIQENYRIMKSDLGDKYERVSDEEAEKVLWTNVLSDHSRGELQPLAIFIGQPKQFINNRNGAIFNYKAIDGLTFQINVDRLVSIGILIDMYKETGVIGHHPEVDKIIRMHFHSQLPQLASLANKNWSYRVNYRDFEGITEYNQYVKKADELIVNGFKRAYRMELNIKSMEDYEKGLGKSVATAFETKKNIPLKVQEAMAKSKFLGNPFKFVEFDEDSDLEKVALVEKYYLDIEPKLPKLPLQALRFRKLGKHSVGGNPATGLYSPHFGSIAVDLRQFDSFIHEYAHAIDYMYEKGEVQSMQYGFTDILNMYEEALPKDVGVRSYYLTPTEVFARGYEVAFRAKYPNLDTGLMKTREKLQQSKAHHPFYKNEQLYKDVIEYMEEYIK